jgi:WD40 repeat protein/tRNA A-37 threonylcarbamoyl transferase component Bud32
MVASEQLALVGRSLGEFVVREPLSSGGFGMVFRAEQPALSREAVIKVLQTRHRASETVVQRFLREAKLASKLDHPFAAHTYAFGAEPDGLLWIAMELVRGTPLDKLLAAQGPIPLARFVPLLDGICEVVHTAHEQGIVHRDLKPGNVMVLSRAGRLLPKLLDFGIAKLADAPADTPKADPSLADTADDDSPAPSDGRLTVEGQTIGSPFYMAPEQWLDAGTVDARTDLYALGVLAYECLTGQPPYTGTNKMAIAMAHARQLPRPLGDGYPAALDAVFTKVLAKRSADRYATALELSAAFRAASGIAAEPAALPRLPDAIRVAATDGAPQPLAQAVAALDAARNAHQGRDALWQIVRVAVRLCGVTALAAHAHVGDAGSGMTTSDSGDALRLLRRRALSDAEWLDLARELVRPFAELRDAHPVPELVAMLVGDGAAPLVELVALRAGADQGGGGGEERVRELLSTAMPLVERALAALAFFASYPLVVESEDVATAWMGVRRGERTPMRVRGKPLVPGQPALVDAQGVPVLSLWPFAQVMPPSPGAPDALFLFDGKGRRGARLVALPEPFEREDDRLWDAFGAILSDDAGASARMSAEEKCPFPGLAAFTPGEASSFFGRERETEAFVNRLRVTPLLAVVGPSGAGKSSFVQAGVLPALPGGWTAITVRPGPAPLVSLAARTAALIGADAGELRAELGRHPVALGDRLRAYARTTSSTIVLVVDQLEELFTLCDDADERARYGEALVRAARAADDPVRVVATLRDDYLLDAEALPALRTRLGPGLQLLTTPAEADLRRILTSPLKVVGYEFDDPALPDEMVRAVARAPGALALLSFTAQKLWELRDRRFRQLGKKAYTALGGVGGALAQHAEATLTAMHPEEQRLVREVFRHLVTADGTRAVLSRAELDQVLGGGAHARGVVEKLVGARLLVISDAADDGPDGGDERVEVTHEALLDAWPRLLGWRREDAEGARLRDQLRAAARQWDERGRPTGALWRGDALAEYRLWRARTPGALTAVETAFAAASTDDAARSRRRRRLLTGGAFVVLSTGVVALLFLNAAAERRKAELHDRLEAQYESQGRRLILDGDPLQGLAYLQKAAELGARGRAHDFLIAEAVAATDGFLFEVRHDNSVRSPAFSPDGTRLLTASFDKTARIWDARTGALLATLQHGDVVGHAAFSPDGTRVVTGSFDNTAAVWDAATGARLHVLEHHAPLGCTVFSPDGKTILTTSSDDTVALWDTATGAQRVALHSDGASVHGCTFSRDGARIAAGYSTGIIRVWEASSGHPIAELHGTGNPWALRFSPDGTRLLATTREPTATIWDLASGRVLATLRHEANVNSAEWSPDGKRITTAANDRIASIWDASSGDKVVELRGHAAGVNHAVYSPDGRTIATVSDDATVRLWDATTGAPLARWLGHRNQVTDAAFDRSGLRLVSISDDGSAIVWDASPQERVVRLAGHTGVVEVAAFSPDGAHVVTAGRDATARVWDATTGTSLFVLRGHDSGLHWAAYSPDGRSIATASDDHTVRTWDATTGAARLVLTGHTASVNNLAWSNDGRTLVSVSDDGTIRGWDGATGAPRFTVKGHLGYAVRSVTFTPDGAAFTTTGDDSAVRTWDAATGAAVSGFADRDMLGAVSFDREGLRAASPENNNLRVWNVWDHRTRTELIGHVGEVTWAVSAWSRDGRLIVTGALDGTARVWDADTGETLAIYPHGRQVWSAGFSPDDTRILTSADDGTAVIRELPTYTGTPDELARLFACRVPFEVEGDRAVPRTIDRSMCNTRSAR